MRDVEDAIGLIELSSIARGYITSDAMVKKAPVRLLESRAVTPGKYLVLVGGDVAEVDEAMKAGIAQTGDKLLDSLFLPQVHEQVLPLLLGVVPPRVSPDAMAIIETGSVASTIVSADAAVKAAEVWLLEMKLAIGIGGKGYFSLTGELHQVQAAVEAATGAVAGQWIVNTEIIARPHEDLTSFLVAKGRIA